MKTKKKTRGQLVKVLDSRFSKYIRLLYSDKKWLCKCVTCWTVDHFKKMQNWHFITRANHKYRRDEKNCHVQCMRCNIYLSGNYKSYTLYMINRYWFEWVTEITNEANKPYPIKGYEIEEIIQHYKWEVERLTLNLTNTV